MSTERLREAAKVLRERTEAATPGSWAEEVEEHQDHGGADKYWHITDAMHDEYVGNIDRAADATYIATMHPDVGLALADWLAIAGADEWAHGPHCLNPCAECDDDPRAGHVRAALRLADLILGDTP